jgi:hypothetical protein
VTYSRKWGEILIDPATGMPPIPDGYFWRVKGPGYLGDYYVVQLRERRTHLPQLSRRIGWTVIKRTNFNPESVRDAAWYALTYDHAILAHFGSLVPIRYDLIGDYPPKRINEANT